MEDLRTPEEIAEDERAKLAAQRKVTVKRLGSDWHVRVGGVFATRHKTRASANAKAKELQERLNADI